MSILFVILAVLFWFAMARVVLQSSLSRRSVSALGVLLLLVMIFNVPLDRPGRRELRDNFIMGEGAAEATEPRDALSGDTPMVAPVPTLRPPREEIRLVSSVESEPIARQARAAPLEPSTPKPAWVEQPAKRVGNLYRLTYVIGPYASREECENEVDLKGQSALRAYMNRLLGTGHAESDSDSEIAFPAGYVRERLVRDTWAEPVTTSFGPWVRLHVLTEIDGAAQADVKSWWRDQQIDGRLRTAGWWWMSAVVGLGLVYAGLRFDDRWRRGSATAAN